MTGPGPCRARVTLQLGHRAQAEVMARALAVEAEPDDGPADVTLTPLKGGRLSMPIEAPRPSLLRAALKAYLQWASCCHQVSQRTEPAPVPQEQ